jgi:hypothetical protein
MAWSWSHTNQAYSNAYDNLRDMEKSDLEIIFAEWHAATDSKGNVDSNNWFKSKYAKALRQAKKLDADVLADFIWEKASEWATCDNGGYDAWMCPSGCGCHTVSFDQKVES